MKSTMIAISEHLREKRYAVKLHKP